MSSRFTQPPLLGALLRMPVERVRDHMLRALHDHGLTDITAAHFQVLRWPGPEGRRPIELAEQAGMTRQAMNYLLGQLEALDYVERRVDPGDVRSRRVHLTDRGTATISVIRDAVAEIERDWAERMGAAEFDELKRLLHELNDAVAGDGPA